ncbi:hypothetical protein [Rhizobium acidisoli]
MAESCEPGFTVSSVARRNGLTPQKFSHGDGSPESI